MKNVIHKILRENKIADLTDTITISYELWTDTRHGGSHIKTRKKQGGFNRVGEGRITDYDIKKVVEKALPFISEDIVDGYIKDGWRFIIYDDSEDINIVLEATNIDGVWQLTVITVMRTDDFNSRGNTHIIKI